MRRISLAPRFSEVRRPAKIVSSRFNGFPGKPLKRFRSSVLVLVTTSLKRGANEIGLR
jgi:hypothetical protein